MPYYEYRCENKHVTCRVRSIKTPDAELNTTDCEQCGGPAELVPSMPSRPILVGSGFHENDYMHGKLGN